MTQMTVDQAMQTGLAHHRAGQLAEAEGIYRQVLTIDPNHSDALHLLGLVAGQCGQLDAGIDLVQRAIQRRPDFSKAHNNLGNFLRQKGRIDESIAAFTRAVELTPDYAEAYANLGASLSDRGRFEQAIAACNKSIELKPDFAQGYYNLGVSLIGAGRIEDAIAAFTRAVALSPTIAEFHYGLANALKDVNRFEEAAAGYNRAIALKPNWAEVISNLGVVQKEMGLVQESIATYRRALSIRSDLAEIHCNLGVALAGVGALDESIAEVERALQLRNDYPEAHCNLGQFLLLRGDFPRGWAEYESRLNVKSLFPSGHFAMPKWTGQEITGQKILLVTEQGFGDAIQFARYAPLVAARGAQVTIECQPELTRLLASCPGVQAVIPRGQPISTFDWHCSLVSLPSIFKTDLDSIPASVPYVHADEKLKDDWAQRFDRAKPMRNIGLVWAGRPDHKNDRNRSIPLIEFAPLFNVNDLQFHSLQKGDSANQIVTARLNLIDWTEDLHDFADTAALIENLDLVITVDTSVAHLAGSLGKPVWVLLPPAPDWRWLLDREDSPWYPTMRLFRRNLRGDWSDVIRTVAEELRK